MMRYLADFIRLKICISYAAFALFGYFSFNAIGMDLLFVSASAFLAAAMTYSFNRITDVEEDALNGHAVNPLCRFKLGKLIVFGTAVLGFLLSYLVSSYTFLFYTSYVICGFVYSYFRVKRVLGLKNVYTAFCGSLALLLGATASGILTSEMLVLYILLSIFLFIGSLLSDIRDHFGDSRSGVNTIPVVFGYHRVRLVCSALLSGFLVMVIVFSVRPFYLAAPPLILTLLHLLSDIPKSAHKTMIFSSYLLPAGALLLNMGVL